MKRLDMSQYPPYMKMGKSCKTREIRKKKVVWPMTITEESFLDGKFRIRPIGKGDIDRVAELWRESYPEVYGSQHEWILFPEEYRGCTVHFYRLINEGDKYSTKPDEWQLLPEMKKLWECLEEINKDSDDELLRKEDSKP